METWSWALHSSEKHSAGQESGITGLSAASAFGIARTLISPGRAAVFRPGFGHQVWWLWVCQLFSEYFLLVTSSSFSHNHLTNGNNISLHSYEWAEYCWKVVLQCKQANVETQLSQFIWHLASSQTVCWMLLGCLFLMTPMQGLERLKSTPVSPL